MKFGHPTGVKQEKPGSQDWYRTIQEEHLARIEREEAEKAQQQAHQSRQAA